MSVRGNFLPFVLFLAFFVDVLVVEDSCSTFGAVADGDDEPPF